MGEQSTDGCLHRNSVYSRRFVTVIVREDKVVREPSPRLSLVRFIAHLKTLDCDVSLIQLQTSSSIDGGHKVRSALGPLVWLSPQ